MPALASMVYIRRRMSTRVPPEPTPELIRSRVRTLPKRFREASADGLAAEWELRVADQAFTVSVADHLCSVRDGPAGHANTVITAQPDVWIAMDEGKVTGGRAFFEDRLAVRGNLDLAVRFQTLFRPFRRARKPADLDQLEVTVAGQRLSTYVMGSGPPLLLLHGLGAFKVTWVPLLSRFAATHRVIVPDLPGHGGSGKPNAEYTPRFFANAMIRLLDELGVERAAVVGNSLGGRVALELALRNPSRVAALALLDPALPGFRWRSIAAFTRVIPTELMAFPVPLRERWMELAIRQLFARPGSLPLARSTPSPRGSSSASTAKTCAHGVPLGAPAPGDRTARPLLRLAPPREAARARDLRRTRPLGPAEARGPAGAAAPRRAARGPAGRRPRAPDRGDGRTSST